VAGQYESVALKKLVWGLKFEVVEAFGTVLGDYAAYYAKRCGMFEVLVGAGAWVVPIPTHVKKERVRGYNQSERIARAFVTYFHGVVLNTDLKKIHSVDSQLEMRSVRERRENVQNVFVWSGSQAPQTVVLIDDVVTTGSTLEAAAKTLKEAGVGRVIALCIAHGG